MNIIDKDPSELTNYTKIFINCRSDYVTKFPHSIIFKIIEELRLFIFIHLLFGK